uniref:Short chain dehydrogenase/reductase family 39U member 1 n=1 Tax=Ovis aries TaxID=9940 RepID=A0AC11CWY1_SHEEP
MISRRRGCPAVMLQSTWRERTSSTLSAGQPGPEADILQSRGPILMGTYELWRLGLAGGELNPYSELLVPSPSPPHSLALLPSQWTVLPIQDAPKYLCLFPLQERWTVSLSRNEGFTRCGYRWNAAFQKEVLSSRLETTQTLARAIAKAPQPPQAWALVTGVAYYQPSLTAEYDEDSPGGDFDFFSNLVTKWEAAARLPGDSTRQVVVRSGVVLGRGGGAIGHMLLPFRLGLGGPIGSGHQFFPWIHIRDLAGILAHALETSHVQGILNGVAPASSTTNAEFARALGTALGRPAFIPLPTAVVQAVFGQERAVMLLEGQKVVPRRTLAAGYQYSFPELGAALKEVIA